jgi:hypothetical protein
MANILGLAGYNSPVSNINKLLGFYGNDVIDVNTGLGYGLNLTSTNPMRTEFYLDRLIATNGQDRMFSFNGNFWSTNDCLPKNLKAKLIKKFKDGRVYAANCILTPGSGTLINYKSRVFYSNFPTLGLNSAGVLGQTVNWGLESGTCSFQLGDIQLMAQLDSASGYSYFKGQGLHIGDPVYLLSGGGVGEYRVSNIPSEFTLVLVTAPPGVNTNINFWAGKNWFDVGTDDNDEIKGLYEAYNRLLIFKQFSLYDYTGTDLQRVKKALGTSSQESIISDWNGRVYWFHGSDIVAGKTGIYMRDEYGLNVHKISRPIDPFIAGMSASNFASVIAWQEGPCLRFFLGNLTNANFDISLNNAVASYNFMTNSWSVDPIADVITATTVYRSNNSESVYNGTSGSLVIQMNNGNTFNGSPIPWVLETKVYYPSGPESINTFRACQIIARNFSNGVHVAYRLWDQPKLVDDTWKDIGELRGDKTELTFKETHKRGSGIQFQFREDSGNEADIYIEKITTFYELDTTELNQTVK